MQTIRLGRRLAAVLPLVLVSALAQAAIGADAKPARKDSPVGARPRQAVLSAKVKPAEAKPGETVTLSVTAKVDLGWHIYGYSRDQPDDGPRVTQFDLFDPAGLAVKGDWSAYPEPIRKKEPLYPDLKFVEYHEDEVTWSIPLVVPADAAPGKRSVRVQVGYQVCSDQSCSFPGQWTLPSIELTVVAPGERPKLDPAVSKTSGEAPAPALDSARPKRKDSKAQPPPGAVLTASVEPASARPGETVSYKVTARLTPKWHIYKYAKEEADAGPKPTQLEMFDPAGLAPQGDFTPSKPPIQHEEKAFKDVVPYVEYYDDEVTWTLPLAIPADAAPGERTLRCQASYMICDDKNCSNPGRWTLPAVALTILPGSAVGVAAVAPAPPAEAPKSAPPSAAPAPAPNKSDVERKADAGLLPFLATCALGGLLALVMPCVWPMIPITVNFFVKQGQKKKGATTGLALAYCGAIIGVFTAVGVLFSVFFGAASLSKLANNPWLNFAVAGLFVAFGLSLLGLFEVRLPNFLLNASAQGEGRGGLVGVMFMALTLTITSFTCTFPVVGGLLVMASNGSYVYPVIGLATFATVLALPFFVLALSPGLLSKVPKSGDWMNAVKVVGGLVEIGAAFKFLNTAEVSFVVPEDAIFNAYTVLTIWVVLALVCGIYLLGLFRTDHDHDAVKVGPGRMVAGAGFLFLSLYLTPALFGHPPRGQVWGLVVGLLPADADTLKAPAAGPAAGGGEEKVAAKSSDPKVAAREQTSFHGVSWGFSFEKAVEDARKSGKPILIDFTGVNCANCRLMEVQVLPRPEVVDVLRQFVTVQLYTDRPPIKTISMDDRYALGEANFEIEQRLSGETTNPNYVVVTPDERVLGTRGGAMRPEEFVAFLKGTLARAAGPEKVAQAGGR